MRGVSQRSRTDQHGAFRAFHYPQFRLLFAASLFSAMLQPVQFLGSTFWMIDHYPDNSAIMVALTAGCRGSGLLLASFFAGAVADRFQRRKILRATECTAFLLVAGIGTLMVTEPLGGFVVVPILALIVLAAGTWAVDMAARSASLPATVGTGALGGAISLSMVAQQLAFPLMVPVVGVAADQWGSGWVYVGALGAWAVILPLVFLLRYESKGESSGAAMIETIRDGLRYSRRNTTILAVMSVVFIQTAIVMPATGPLAPVFLTKVVDISKSEFGFVGALWGVGAAGTAMFFALNQRLARRGTTLCVTVLVLCLSAIVFGHSRSLVLSALANGTLGIGVAGTLVTAQTVVQYVATDAMRGRVMALFPLFQGMTMVVALPVGLIGQGVGIEFVVPAAGYLGLLLAVSLIVTRPVLRRVRPEVEPLRASPFRG